MRILRIDKGKGKVVSDEDVTQIGVTITDDETATGNELVKGDENDAGLGDDTSEEDSNSEGNDVTVDKVDNAQEF